MTVNDMQTKADRVAACASSACALHCVGTAALTPWIPGLAVLTEQPWLEWLLLIASVAVAVWSWTHTRPRPSQLMMWVLGAVLAASGLATATEALAQLGFVMMAVTQVVAVLARRRQSLR